LVAFVISHGILFIVIIFILSLFYSIKFKYLNFFIFESQYHQNQFLEAV